MEDDDDCPLVRVGDVRERSVSHRSEPYVKRTTSVLLTAALTTGTAAVLAAAIPGVASANACGVIPIDQNSFTTAFDTKDTRATGHNDIKVDNPGALRVWTEGTKSTDKAAAYYGGLDVALASQTALTNYSLNYQGTPTGTLPGYQLVVDLDDDGTADGILIGEKAYGANWWLSNATPQEFKDKAPHKDGTSGAAQGGAHYGTLDEWVTAFPAADITAFGYSLGSGVKNDLLIDSITFGCNVVDFGYTNTPPTADFTWAATATDPSTIAFDATPSADVDEVNGDVLTYAWDFRDGTLGTGEKVTHKYNAPGTYAVELTVTDRFGATAKKLIDVVVARPTNTAGGTPLPGTGANVIGLAAVGGLVLAGSSAGLVATRRRRAGSGAHAA